MMMAKSAGDAHFLVMRGLDPRIHAAATQHGLCRVKPGNDEQSSAPNLFCCVTV